MIEIDEGSKRSRIENIWNEWCGVKNPGICWCALIAGSGCGVIGGDGGDGEKVDLIRQTRGDT